MISRAAVIAGGVGGLVLAFVAFTIINALWLLPAARTEARSRLIAEQAVQSQKEELERKGDDARLQRLSDFDLCVAYLGRVPECDSLRMQPVSEE